MIRMSEAVLDGHPDRFCDLLAEEVIHDALSIDPEGYGQIEVAVWSDLVWFSGATVTRDVFSPDLDEIVRRVGTRVGYVPGNAVDAARYRIVGDPCFLQGDPRQWTHHVNDQSIVHGWAGYDARVGFLPPEHFLALAFREALIESFHGGPLAGQGPDGKLLVRLREESSLGARAASAGPTGLLGDRWILEHVLVTLQHLEDLTVADLAERVDAVLEAAYTRLAGLDPRWERSWGDVRLLVNPNGPLLNGGSDGDNGQTGRKLVMDYYGPRVPIGGGAKYGKDPTHIDRAGADAAREAALRAVEAAAAPSDAPFECLVTVMYAPNLDEPLDVRYVANGSVAPEAPAWFAHSAVRGRSSAASDFYPTMRSYSA